MESIPQSAPLSIGLVVLAVVFAVLAVLYAMGTLQFLVSDPHATHHYTHAILFGVLAVASLIAANFTRPRAA
jgi:ABC-type thiamin/hydroxymethylpyrimidine transport system permease subunit